MDWRWFKRIKQGVGASGLLLAALILASCGAVAPVNDNEAAEAPTPTSTETATLTATQEPTPAPTTTLTASATPTPDLPLAPELEGGGEWLNSAPLTLAELRGKVVLIDFWTYGCINCVRTLPYVQEWWQNYRDQGLVIIGVHTPEFRSEHDIENVRAAIERLNVSWPVVQDNNMQIWRAYGNRYWPRFYLIDKQGRIIYDHIGEGGYDRTEREIIAALNAES